MKMTRTRIWVLVCGVLMAGAIGCETVPNNIGNPNDPNDPNNQPPNLTGLLNLLLTNIAVHPQGRIEVGDDLIAFTENLAGSDVVNYIVPSAGDTAGRGVPNPTDYDDNNFAVSGKKLILCANNATRNDDFAVTIYDTETGSMDTISTDDIRLTNYPVGNYVPGFLQVDGDYVVTRNSPSFTEVLDGKVVKVIDISGATPQVISFTENPGGSDDDVEQVAVDAETKLAVAVRDNVVYVYDIDNPGAAPTEFDLTAMGGIEDNDMQCAFDNGMLLYHEGASVDRDVYMLDVTDPNNTPTLLNGEGSTGANARFELFGNDYCYLFAGPASQGNASACGTQPNLTPLVGSGDTILPNSTNRGRFGYGDTIAICRLNGATAWFLAGRDSSQNTMQYSTDGATWMTIPDPNDPDDEFQAADVVTDKTGTLIGYKHEIGGDTFLGYAPLP